MKNHTTESFQKKSGKLASVIIGQVYRDGNTYYAVKGSVICLWVKCFNADTLKEHNRRNTDQIIKKFNTLAKAKAYIGV